MFRTPTLLFSLLSQLTKLLDNANKLCIIDGAGTLWRGPTLVQLLLAFSMACCDQLALASNISTCLR